MSTQSSSLGGGLAQLGVGVGETHVELLGALDEGLALLGTDVLGDLAGVHSVVHEQELDVLGGADQELLEAGGQHVAGVLVLLVADLGHAHGATEAAAHGAVDTAGLPPGGLNTRN